MLFVIPAVRLRLNQGADEVQVPTLFFPIQLVGLLVICVQFHLCQLTQPAVAKYFLTNILLLQPEKS